MDLCHSDIISDPESLRDVVMPSDILWNSMVITPTCTTLLIWFIQDFLQKYMNQFLLSLLQDLSSQISQSKLIPPNTQVTCLSILVDTVTRTISILPEKLEEIQNMCTQWTLKSTCTKNTVTILIGLVIIHYPVCMTCKIFYLIECCRALEITILATILNFHNNSIVT